MNLKLLKYIVQAVVIEEDEDGHIVGERMSEPQVFYGADALREFIDRFELEMSVPQEIADE